LNLETSPSLVDRRGVYISTYGCQMNVNDSERMLSLLEMLNYESVTSPEDAELIIINSCSVREKPVHKVHSEVGRYRELKKSKPQLKIGVGGCVAQQEKKKLLDDIPLLDFVFGTDAIDELPQIVSEVTRAEDQLRINSTKFQHAKPYQIETLVRNPGVSTFVNITKGCDNFCTFCVVPYTRGRERSRLMEEIVRDVKSLVNRGVKEVTLLGQNVNSYKSACGAGFADLLETLATQTEIKRLRYTTSHPKDYDEHLAQISQTHRQVICDYIHLPVQSGSSEVLERMNRGYTREQYLEKVEMIKRNIPGVALSTDIIVGFPGETEEQFEETVSLLDLVGYESIYAFMYSPRPFTKAARWPDQIPQEEKSRRLQRLFAVQTEISLKLAQRYAGQAKEILVEAYDEKTGNLSGRTSENKLTHFAGSKDLIGQILPVRITEVFPTVLRGELA
jgi:tRNA-2-methylthio-N6-dimethylallyladenosine synthase